MSCLLYSEPLAAAAQCEQRNACLVDPKAGNLPTYNTFNASPSSTILPKLSNMSVERDRQLWSMCAGPLLQQKRRGPKGCKRPGEYWVQKGSFKHELIVCASAIHKPITGNCECPRLFAVSHASAHERWKLPWATDGFVLANTSFCIPFTYTLYDHEL